MMNSRTKPLTWLAIALVVAIGLMVAFGTWAMSAYGGYYGMMGGGSWSWGFVMMAVPGIVLVVILLAALGGLREPAAYPAYAPASANALDVLEQRYARGELSREDYLKIREDLTHGPTRS